MKKLAMLLGLLLLLGGCAEPMQLAADEVDGTWMDVEDPQNVLIFKGRSGRVRFQNVERDWSYDSEEHTYIIQCGEEAAEGVLEEENGLTVFVIKGEKYAREKDYAQVRGEYLAQLSQKAAQQSPKEERIAAFLEEYEALFYSSPIIEQGWSYSLASKLGEVKFIQPWKTEGEKMQLNIKLDLTGAEKTLMARTEGNEIFLSKQVSGDLFSGGMVLNWHLYGEPVEEPVNCQVQLEPGKFCEITADCYWDNLETRKLTTLDELVARHGFWEDRETVFAAIEEAGLPAAYALVQLERTQYLLDFTELMEG